MKSIIVLLSLILCLFLPEQTFSSGCTPAQSHADLDINNVRARIMINGDRWWDLVGSSLYEIPVGSGKKPFFAGAFWFGGVDQTSNLAVAAQTYRQSGSDFWPGPINNATVDVSASTCLLYDQIWKITRDEVLNFRNNGIATPAIMNWPGNGDPALNETQFLAPFVDVNSDGAYNYLDGDYPAYDFGTSLPMESRLNGDQTLWWVFNDVGNIHAESSSTSSLGIEVQAQAFAFCATSSDINNVTFYSYKIINRSSNTYSNCYAGIWTDPDLGNYGDDFVGCDVSRSLGFVYNGDSNDDGTTGYGLIPPAAGVQILQGLWADSLDGVDNDYNGQTDEVNEQSKMSRFVCYENSFTSYGNPTLALHYYNYLKGIWKDNTPINYGGNGFHSSTINTSFMFPDSSDVNWVGTNGVVPTFAWSEMNTNGSASNVPGDRRFLHSLGPVTMPPGQVQFILMSALWARAASGDQLSSLANLKVTADSIQAFFDRNFTQYPSCFTGIAEVTDNALIELYPSITNQYIQIRFLDAKQNTGQIKSVSIFDSTGKKVLFYENGFEKLSVTALQSGVYFAKVITSKGNSIAKRFIVEH